MSHLWQCEDIFIITVLLWDHLRGLLLQLWGRGGDHAGSSPWTHPKISQWCCRVSVKGGHLSGSRTGPSEPVVNPVEGLQQPGHTGRVCMHLQAVPAIIQQETSLTWCFNKTSLAHTGASESYWGQSFLWMVHSVVLTKEGSLVGKTLLEIWCLTARPETFCVIPTNLFLVHGLFQHRGIS